MPRRNRVRSGLWRMRGNLMGTTFASSSLPWPPEWLLGVPVPAACRHDAKTRFRDQTPDRGIETQSYRTGNYTLWSPIGQGSEEAAIPFMEPLRFKSRATPGTHLGGGALPNRSELARAPLAIGSAHWQDICVTETVPLDDLPDLNRNRLCEHRPTDDNRVDLAVLSTGVAAFGQLRQQLSRPFSASEM